MPRFLYKVEQVIEISRRCVAAEPGIKAKTPGIRPGVALELRRPDGSIIDTYISAIPFVTTQDSQHPIKFTFPPGLTKLDIPIGTEVWLKNPSQTA